MSAFDAGPNVRRPLNAAPKPSSELEVASGIAMDWRKGLPTALAALRR